MKPVIALLFLTFFSFDVTAQVIRPTSFDGRNSCDKAKGVWRQFGNGCADECESKFDEFAVCPETIISGCDCGKGRCWKGGEAENSGSCVSLSEYQKFFNNQKESDNKLLAEARKERAERYKKQRSKRMEEFVKSNAGDVPAAPSDNNDPKNAASQKNNLKTFYGKYQSQMAAAQAQAVLQQVPPLENKNDPNLLSTVIDNKPAAPAMTPVPANPNQLPPGVTMIPPTSVEPTIPDPSSITVPVIVPATVPAATITPAKSNPALPIGTSPVSQDPNRTIAPSKSLIVGGTKNNGDDEGIPQLPMP